MPTAFVSFAEVKARVGFEPLLDRYGLIQGLTRKGETLAGPCPVCGAGGKRPFTVNLRKNAWYCFGKCQGGGNVLDFVARKEGVEIRRAAELLNRWFELDLERTPATAAAGDAPKAARAKPLVALPEANPPLSFALKQIDPAHPAFAAYGLTEPTARAFEAGYCAKGLLKDRLAIPIRSLAGELVAYVGLDLDPEAKERYKFPPNFFPELEVFNLYRCLGCEDREMPLLLALEVVDVLYLAEQGLSFAAGLFSSRISPQQKELLFRVLPDGAPICIVSEGDQAGSVTAELARRFAVRQMGFDSALRAFGKRAASGTEA